MKNLTVSFKDLKGFTVTKQYIVPNWVEWYHFQGLHGNVSNYSEYSL